MRCTLVAVTVLRAHCSPHSAKPYLTREMSLTHRRTGNITRPGVKADCQWQGKVLKKAPITLSSYGVRRLKVGGHFLEASCFLPLLEIKKKKKASCPCSVIHLYMYIGPAVVKAYYVSVWICRRECVPLNVGCCLCADSVRE